MYLESEVRIMTIAQLIEELKKYPQDACFMNQVGFTAYQPVEEIDYEEEYNIISIFWGKEHDFYLKGDIQNDD